MFLSCGCYKYLCLDKKGDKMDSIISSKINEIKIKEDSAVVSKFLTDSSNEIETLFKRAQIEDDRKIMLEIRECLSKLFEIEKERLLSDEVKKSLKESVANLRCALQFNVNQYGPIDERTPIKSEFEEKEELIEFPRTLEDIEKIVNGIEIAKSKDSSSEYLNKTIFGMELIKNHKNNNEQHQEMCDALSEKCRHALNFNIGLFGPIDQRRTPPAPIL